MHPAKVNTINTIQLISDTAAQLEYQSKAQINVANELVNQWFDDFYHPDSDWYRTPFTEQELSVLSEFNEFYDERVQYLPNTLAEMLKNYAWKEVVGKAQWVLNMLNWQGVVATYENS